MKSRIAFVWLVLAAALQGQAKDVTVKSQFNHGYSFPCMFNLPPTPSQGGGVWVLVSETGTTGAYCGTLLFLQTGTHADLF